MLHVEARGAGLEGLEPNGARGVRLNVDAHEQVLTARASIDAPDGVTGFGRLRLDYGDGASTPTSGIVSASTFRHTYRRAGTYVVTIWLQLRDGSMRSDRATVTIR